MIHVVYDDTCGFCNRCRMFIQKRQTTSIDFIGYQTPRVALLLKEYPELYDKRAQTIIVLESNSKPATKYIACLKIARNMRHPWPVITSVLGIIPRVIGDFGYDVIARLRPLLSKLAGTT